MIAVVLAEAAAILLLGVLVAGLLRSHAEILRRLHELGAGVEPDGSPGPVDVPFEVQPGIPAPRTSAPPARDLAGVSPDGDAIGIGVVGTPHHTVVAFLSSGCHTCAGFWHAFRATDLALPGNTRLVVVTKSGGEESESAVRALAPPGVPVVMSSGAWAEYEVPVSPYFLVVDGPSGRVVGEGAASSWAQVANLMGQAMADRDRSARPGADRRTGNGAYRESRVDAELLAAGITPGHPSLYPTVLPAPPTAGRPEPA